MATTTPNFGWAVPTSTDLVKDGAVAIETLGDSIDASLVDLKGGTTNQVLAKNSNTDMDFKWVADASGIPATIIDAKGDLIAGTAADTAARLAVGADYGFLYANSGAATGIEWNATAWTAYTPTISSNGGTITTATAAGYWIRIGKLCVVRSSWTVTTNGTGSISLNLSLPFTGASAGIGSTGVGREYAVTGKELQIEIGSGDTVMRFRNYDNSYPAGNSYQGTGTICYEVA
jgi:hypothetical protein